jgi:hypothetical protein
LPPQKVLVGYMDGKLSTHYTRWAYDEKGLKKNEREKIEFNFFFQPCMFNKRGLDIGSKKNKM